MTLNRLERLLQSGSLNLLLLYWRLDFFVLRVFFKHSLHTFGLPSCLFLSFFRGWLSFNHLPIFIIHKVNVDPYFFHGVGKTGIWPAHLWILFTTLNSFFKGDGSPIRTGGNCSKETMLTGFASLFWSNVISPFFHISFTFSLKMK